MLEATLLALGAAVLHAGWNLFIKTSDDRFLTAWGLFLFGGVLTLPVLAVIGLPQSDALPYLGASSVVHVVYTVALVRAYHHGDFSFAYPIARGGGGLLAAIGGVAFLADDLSALSWLAIAVVSVGLASLVRRQVGRLALLWAGWTAVTIGVYTTLDAAGARHTDSGFAYGIAVFIGAAIAVSVYALATGRGPELVPYLRGGSLTRIAFGGVAAVVAYSLVLTAVRLAPVGYVASIRESSVVLGAAAGWLLLHERLGRGRLASSFVVAAGLVLLVVSR